jgi:hypothetical protein
MNHPVNFMIDNYRLEALDIKNICIDVWPYEKQYIIAIKYT